MNTGAKIALGTVALGAVVVFAKNRLDAAAAERARLEEYMAGKTTVELPDEKATNKKA